MSVDPVKQELHVEEEQLEELEEQETDKENSEDLQLPDVRRLTRASRPVERPNLRLKGKFYLQEERTTRETCKDDVVEQLEYCHNLIAPDDIKYATSHAVLI